MASVTSAGTAPPLELPVVDWNDVLTGNRDKFLYDLRHALSNIGFLVLVNHPDFKDDFQQAAFKEVSPPRAGL